VVANSSGVFLSPGVGGDDTRDDGVLQAWECYGPEAIRLRAEVVALSACRSGGGEQRPGEGIIGLTRALQVAGARGVVASQWSVADASTPLLMLAFHRALRAGRTKDQALRRAMVQTARRWPHPFHWAPFFLAGDPRPLRPAGKGRAAAARVRSRTPRAALAAT